MRIATKIHFNFGRRSQQSSNFNYEEVAQMKWNALKTYSNRYHSDDKFQHEDKLFEEFVYGNTVILGGITPYSYKSLKFAKSVMKWAKPNLLMLGGLNDNYLRYFEGLLGLRKHYEHPLHRPERMQCKERMSRYLQSRLEQDDSFIWHENKKQLYVINHKDRRVVPQPYLSVAHASSTEESTRLAFGKPSDTLILEDLIMRYDVAELKEMAERAIKKCKDRQEQSTSWHYSYTRQAIQNYVMSEQPQIYNKEVTYQTALLKRYAKLFDKILLLLPGYFIERVASQVHHISVKPENIYRYQVNDSNSEVYGLLQKTLRDDPQTILEKFALLVLMKESWIENEFARGVNVFQPMLFGQLFKDMSMEELHARYYKAKAKVEEKWYQLMHHRVNNIHVQRGPHIKMTLSQQFQLLKKRATKDFPYTYQEKNYISQYEDQVKMQIIYKKIADELNEQGNKHRIMLFDHFMQGYMSKEAIILFSKMLGKMNVQLEDRLKLPVFHYGAFRGIYKEYLRDFLIRGDKNSEIEEKLKKRTAKIENMLDKEMKKLENPYQLERLLSGKTGKEAVSLDFDMQKGPSFEPEDVQKLEAMFGQMTPADVEEMKEQFGQNWDEIVDDKDEFE